MKPSFEIVSLATAALGLRPARRAAETMHLQPTLTALLIPLRTSAPAASRSRPIRVI
jgi:hypothetical protein